MALSGWELVTPGLGPLVRAEIQGAWKADAVAVLAILL